MKKLINQWRALAHDESGAAAVEYGLLAGLIAVFIAASVGAVGTNLEAVFTAISTAIAL